MSFLFLVNVALLVALSPSPNCAVSNDNCLPAGIQPTDVVSTQVARPGTHGKVGTVTVAEKLKELKARCRKHKLVDARGTEIRFYQLVGCWGNHRMTTSSSLSVRLKNSSNCGSVIA